MPGRFRGTFDANGYLASVTYCDSEGRVQGFAAEEYSELRDASSSTSARYGMRLVHGVHKSYRASALRSVFAPLQADTERRNDQRRAAVKDAALFYVREGGLGPCQ